MPGLDISLPLSITSLVFTGVVLMSLAAATVYQLDKYVKSKKVNCLLLAITTLLAMIAYIANWGYAITSDPGTQLSTSLVGHWASLVIASPIYFIVIFNAMEAVKVPLGYSDNYIRALQVFTFVVFFCTVPPYALQGITWTSVHPSFYGAWNKAVVVWIVYLQMFDAWQGIVLVLFSRQIRVGKDDPDSIDPDFRNLVLMVILMIFFDIAGLVTQFLYIYGLVKDVTGLYLLPLFSQGLIYMHAVISF